MRLPVWSRWIVVDHCCAGNLAARAYYFAADVLDLRDWLARAHREWNASGIVEQHLIVRSIARDVDVNFCHCCVPFCRKNIA